MIQDYSVNINTYRDKVLDNYGIFPYRCPKCGAMHSFSRHATYTRNICYETDNCEICEDKIKILRVLCGSCDSTHAILPNDVIPYKIFTQSSVIDTTAKHFIHEQSISSICAQYKISYQTFCSFITMIALFNDSLTNLLRISGYFFNMAKINVAEMLKALVEYSETHNVAYRFYCHTNKPFLMTKFHGKLSMPVYIGAYF